MMNKRGKMPFFVLTTCDFINSDEIEVLWVCVTVSSLFRLTALKPFPGIFEIRCRSFLDMRNVFYASVMSLMLPVRRRQCFL